MLAPMIPPAKRDGQPRDDVNVREVLDSIFYVLSTGCQWKALPPQFGAWQSVYRRFRQWVDAGVFEEVWRVMLVHYDELEGLDWQWTCADGFMTKAPKGGILSGRRPSTGDAAGPRSTS